MKNTVINWLVKSFVGKNAPALGRAVANWIAGLLLASVIFTGGDFGIGDGYEIVAQYPPDTDTETVDPNNPFGNVPVDPELVVTRADVDDGLTMGEVFRLLIALGLAGVSRVTSYLRARRLDWLGEKIGWLVGRSAPSLLRFLLEGASGVLGYFALVPAGTDAGALAEMPLATLAGALILYVLGRILSAVEDGKRNPVPVKMLGR